MFGIEQVRPEETCVTLYVVSCALRDPSHDYSPLWNALDRRGAKRAMEAVWLLESNDGIPDLTQAVLPMLKDDDRLLIAVIGQWSATHLLEEAQEFLRGKM